MKEADILFLSGGGTFSRPGQWRSADIPASIFSYFIVLGIDLYHLNPQHNEMWEHNCWNIH
jgi:hypothetical protein